MKAGWVNGQDQDHRRNTTRWVHSRFVSLVSTVWLRRWTSGMILFYRSRRETIESNGYRWVTSSKWGYVTWTVKLFRVFEFFILIFVSFLFWIDFIFEVSFLEISDLRGEIFDPREVCNEIYRVLWILRIFKFESIFFYKIKILFFYSSSLLYQCILYILKHSKQRVRLFLILNFLFRLC